MYRYEDKESSMIKPMDEYTPEQRAFVRWVEELRKAYPPKNGGVLRAAGPINVAEIRALLADLKHEEGE
jgi:hypothetical protein